MEITKEKFFDDARNWAKTGSGALIIGAFGLVTYIYLLPFLDNVVWTSLHLIYGLIALAGTLFILTRPFTWRIIGVIRLKLAKIITLGMIEWDDFAIQEYELAKKKKEREGIRKEADNLLGLVYEQNIELTAAKKKLDSSNILIQDLRNEGKTDDDDEVQLYGSEVVRQMDFINDIQPLRDDTEELAKLLQEAYKRTGNEIADVENELKIQKRKLDILTKGENGIKKAFSIFKEENPEATLAKEMVKKKMAQKMGSIRNTTSIITPIMNEQSRRDKAKIKLALQQIKTVRVDGQPLSIEQGSSSSNFITTPTVNQSYDSFFKNK